ncbi:MAG: hypothetical protein JRG95_10050 [Deltaproteobacteria bacterium]|nr:hypothetical protein [Deltaproteobacteria bacterium]
MPRLIDFHEDPTTMPFHLFARPLVLILAVFLVSCGAGPLQFTSPELGFLSAPGDVAFELSLPSGAETGSLVILLDGAVVPSSQYAVLAGTVQGTLSGVAAGDHWLDAEVVSGDLQHAETSFSLIALVNPDSCDILNQVECSLPFPSSRFEEPAPTPTGVRIAYQADTLPVVTRLLEDGGFLKGPVSPTPFLQNDGFSPTVQVLMHFEQTPDAALSGAARLLPTTRTYDESGAQASSPTLLIDWQTGKREIHWIENDANAIDPGRVVTFLRPGRSLRPGHRYIVAVRKLVDSQGAPVEPEPVFEAIRDGAPSDLPAVEIRRAQIEPVLSRLDELGVPTDDLILAFDFQVMSDHSLTHEMLSMRDQAFAWRDAQAAAGIQTFTVDAIDELNPGCTDPNEPIWRFVTGTYEVPLFLDRDPFVENDRLSNLMHDAGGLPSWNTLTNAPYGIAIPCDALATPLPPVLLGHGLFGDGPGFVETVAGAGLTPPFITGGTNWSGLSTLELQPDLTSSFIFKVIANTDETPALADRLRQGQTHALLLARMLHRGDFNLDPAFQNALGQGVILPDDEMYYFGASLGGIMGNMFAALTPDVERLLVDVPAINFSLLLDRAAPFRAFELLAIITAPDRMNFSIGLGLIHETWVRGEPAGYATHITDDPLPGVPFAKRILMQVALHDHQVSNLGAQLAGATMRLPVQEGSVMQDLAGMENSTGPQDSAYVVYDTAAFDLSNPAHLPFVPPLVNDQVPETVNGINSGKCDPHGRQALTPAALDQLEAFFQPYGQVENFCTDDGICNASTANEFPFGIPIPCDPLS